MASQLHVRSESDSCVSLLGGHVKIEYPFVHVDLIRDESSDKKPFIPTHIPVSEIIGMFDLTESEARAYAFHPSPE